MCARSGKARKLSCFIIMPFSKAAFEGKDKKSRSLNEDDLNVIYQSYFRQAIHEYHRGQTSFAQVRRFEDKAGGLIAGIVQNLHNDELVLADLTGLNPNVCYELGVRHSLKRGTIIVTQNRSTIPSDLRGYLSVEYQYPRRIAELAGCQEKFKTELWDAIDKFLDYPGKPDSPVLDYLDKMGVSTNVARAKELKGNLKWMQYLQDQYEASRDRMIDLISQWAKGTKTGLYEISIPIEPFLQLMVIQDEDVAVVQFLHWLLTDITVSQQNMQALRDSLVENRNVNRARHIPFGFCDWRGRYHSIISLKSCCRGVKGVKRHRRNQSDPVWNSFSNFMRKWKDELDELP